MLNFLLADTANEPAGNLCSGNTMYTYIGIGVLLILFLAWSFYSNRKRGKQMNDMRSTIRIGDEIMTIGGIIGTVVEVKERSAADKEFVIETGSDGSKCTMKFDFRALGENRTRMREIQAEAAKRAEQQRIEKEAKKQLKNGDVFEDTKRFEPEIVNKPSASEQTESETNLDQ